METTTLIKHDTGGPNSLKGVIWGSIQGSIIRVSKGDTRSLNIAQMALEERLFNE